VTIEQASTGTDGKFKIKSEAGTYMIYKEKAGYTSVNIPDMIELSKGISTIVQIVSMKKDAPVAWTIEKGAAPYKVTTPPVECSIGWFFDQAAKAGAICTIRIVADGVTLNRNNWKAGRWYRFDGQGDSRHAVWFDATYTTLVPGQDYFISTSKAFTISDFTKCKN